jgi:membrane fusion protein, multidrug efflux system
MLRISYLALLPLAAAWSQQTELATVTARRVERTVELPGEILPYQKVALHARVPGYRERVLVDRGSVVKRGQLLAEVTAPEMQQARVAEAQSRVETATAGRAQAQAQLAAAESTWERLKQATATPGAVACNEIVLAEKQVDAARAAVHSREQSIRTAEAAVRALKDAEAYLKIAAPFGGVVTERLLHPGALVKPDAEPPILILQQVSRLRLAVPVPEQGVGAIPQGASVAFRVPAYPQRTFTGTVARVAHTLDEKTRSMAVELDVANRDGALAPGMYPTVAWPMRGAQMRLFVPSGSVVTTTERTFVIRVRGGKTEWVNVRKGVAAGDQLEVFGALDAGDRIVKRATDELRDGTAVK